MRVAIAGGGTGGHVVPAIALARALRRRDRDVGLLFIGSGRPVERDLVAGEGIPYRVTRSRSLPRRPGLGTLVSLAANVLGALQALTLLRRFRPDVVVATGGYPAAPAGAAAVLLRVPLVLVDGNVVPGVTTRALARWARAVAVAHPSVARRLGDGRAVVTGWPLRDDLTGGDRDAFLRAHGLDPGRRTVLIVGGSQGARSLNLAAVEAARWLRERGDLQVVHQTGDADLDAVRRATASLERAALRYAAVPFIHRMGDAYAAADLVVSRAGGMTLAELTALGLPAIVVPYPHATEGHQDENAAALARAGAAVVVADRDLSGERLAREIAALANDPDRRAALAARSRALGAPDATARVLDLVDRVVRR